MLSVARLRVAPPAPHAQRVPPRACLAKRRPSLRGSSAPPADRRTIALHHLSEDEYTGPALSELVPMGHRLDGLSTDERARYKVRSGVQMIENSTSGGFFFPSEFARSGWWERGAD